MARVTDEPIRAGQDWEAQAQLWIAWARRPDFDSYYRYRDEFFALLPPPGGATLDVGCGEGRVTRDLTAHGHTVTGVDAAPTMIAAARDLDPAGSYVVADAAQLPFPDARFDLVVGYNTFMDVPDVTGTLRDVCRVLAPGGRLCFAITHPITNSWSRMRSPDGQRFVRGRSYFAEMRYVEHVLRDGTEMVFQGWYRPLTAYTRPLEDAGLLIEAIREPEWEGKDVPYHLWVRAMRP